MSANVSFLVLVLFSVTAHLSRADDCDKKAEVMCYYASWSLYRVFEGKFTTENIDPQLCTQLIYSFAGLDLNLQVASLDSNADVIQGGFYNMSSLKEQNPCLKTILAVGGWNEGSIKYSVMANDENRRKQFAESALKFVTYYGFDGLDLDWEYPTSRGGIPADKANFVSLLKVLKETLAPWGLSLSIAAGMDTSYYDVASIVKYVDYVNLMAYDMVSSDSSVTGLLAPLSTIKEKVNEWIDNGASPNQLVLGIPTYARCFNLEQTNRHDIGDSVVANTTCGGIWTDQDGFLAYYEVEEYVKECSTATVSDGNAYAWCDDVWMTYDNEETVALKAQYTLDEGLGGVMIWSIDTDDFAGLYSDVKYPLLNSIYNTINKN